MIPRSSDNVFVSTIENYLCDIKDKLGAFKGRVFYTGTPSAFVNSPMGKNMISNVPRDIAKLLEKEDAEKFTFHSLRRTSATAAADSGASVQQMMTFYGWDNPNMPQEYVSTSKATIKSMPQKLTGDTTKEENEKPMKRENSESKTIYIEHFSGVLNM